MIWHQIKHSLIVKSIMLKNEKGHFLTIIRSKKKKCRDFT